MEMKKVTAFVGSARKKNTYRAVEQYLENLQDHDDVEGEIVVLSQYNLGICRGCQQCFSRGEEFCPLKDDRDVLFAKIDASDGVILATPNYTWDMSGMMKVFLDRFGFACHRPRYFGKAFTSIVIQAVGRGNRVVENLDFTGKVLGFSTMKGMTITAFDPRTEKQQRKIDRDLAAHSRRYHTLLDRPAHSAPSLFQLVAFRFGRTLVNKKANPGSLDYRYFAERGWLKSEYYYATQLNPAQRLFGTLVDSIASAM